MKSRQASAASTSTSAVRRRLARGVHRLAGTQQRLRRDARPVRALAADQLALDERDAQAALGERAGAVLAGRAAADHDHVVVAAHVGSSAPACSRTMYSAYQSGQFASASPVRSSCSPWAAAARRSAPARSLAEANACCPVDAAGQPRRDLLQQPAVAVRVAERGERAVARAIGRRPRYPPCVVELSAAGALVEHLAHVGAVRDQVGARRLDVGDDQVQALGRAGRGRRDARAELDRAPGAGRRELDDPESPLGRSRRRAATPGPA